MWLDKKHGYLQDWITQVWVKTTGKHIDIEKENWLAGPAGDTDSIKDNYIHRLCKDEELRLEKNQPGAGLINDIAEWQLTAKEQASLHPAIIDFYTHTYNYSFQVTSKWCGAFYPFGWLLAIIFSRRLQQLNLPLHPSDTAQGLDSSLIKLYPKNSAKPRYTIWYRTLKGLDTVVFSGIYGHTHVERVGRRCLKIIFPLPNGNATIILGIKVKDDGGLLLTSKGKQYGDPGFYFLLTDGKNKHWARYVKAMHENLDVFVDGAGTLKATHTFKFYGLTFMTLGYTMAKKRL
jgi:hypothetical protein